MALSTLPISIAERGPASGALSPQRLNLAALRRFYARQARIYDWTRPFILHGRDLLVKRMGLAPGARVLDVGCGTGWTLLRLIQRGAEVTGVDCSPAMLARARAKIERRGARVTLDDRPYGTHSDFRGYFDAIIFSYSLSMIPPYADVLASAVEDLRPGGEIAVVDFMTAPRPVAAWLRANHVHVGTARTQHLIRLCPSHLLRIARTSLWSYYLFWGWKEGGRAPGAPQDAPSVATT